MKIGIYPKDTPLIPPVKRVTKITDKTRKKDPIKKRPRKIRGEEDTDSKKGTIVDTEV